MKIMCIGKYSLQFYFSSKKLHENHFVESNMYNVLKQLNINNSTIITENLIIQKLKYNNLQKYNEFTLLILQYYNKAIDINLLSEEEIDLAINLYKMVWTKCIRENNRPWCVNPEYLARLLLQYVSAQRNFFVNTRFDNEKYHKKYAIKDYIQSLFIKKNDKARIIQKKWRSHLYKRIHAANIIHRTWKQRISNPKYLLCKRRLKNEFMILSDDMYNNSK